MVYWYLYLKIIVILHLYFIEAYKSSTSQYYSIYHSKKKCIKVKKHNYNNKKVSGPVLRIEIISVNIYLAEIIDYGK